MQVLPPPGCFHGPFVSVDMLMDIFLRLILPDKGKQFNSILLHNITIVLALQFKRVVQFYKLYCNALNTEL